MYKELNNDMTNPESLLANEVIFLDKRGRELGVVNLFIAKQLVASGMYYCVSTADISFM